jgi:hypothetical protein
MENENFCQSCSMPLDHMHGTEKDGSLSKEYCQYCYQNGAFVNPNMTMEEMKTIVKTEMEKRSIGQDLIDKAVNVLPYLKRWKKSADVLR